MTSAYLTAAIERCKLPIRVEFVPLANGWWVFPMAWPYCRYEYDFLEDPAEATRAYLSLVHQLQSAAPRPKLATSPTDAADASPATAAQADCSSPGQSAAILSSGVA